ncbi:MAG: (d)CMP kinase [Firmicutes bacterium]|nr:(d)CMP kinase [Erysipelotrichaceae bacterium]MDD7228293.1 (d)CMP kinase [Bacillota bacterium]MDY5998616.1 (d)CMP kinase [Erysipelotrichaceae bacterium]
MINIAIDGPSGAGKSSIAKILAKKLTYTHLDTGSMYRAVAYKAMMNHLDIENEDVIVDMLKDTDIRLTNDGKIYLDDTDVSDMIRTNEISLLASNVSKHAKVRKDLVSRQQKMALNKGVIMDGRDIGTVVLKDAEVKIFLTASTIKRAQRRYLQNQQLNIASDLDQLIKEIEQRDYQDTHRAASPLVKASDAIEIDSSDITIDEVVDKILEIVNRKVNVK